MESWTLNARKIKNTNTRTVPVCRVCEWCTEIFLLKSFHEPRHHCSIVSVQKSLCSNHIFAPAQEVSWQWHPQDLIVETVCTLQNGDNLVPKLKVGCFIRLLHGCLQTWSSSACVDLDNWDCWNKTIINITIILNDCNNINSCFVSTIHWYINWIYISKPLHEDPKLLRPTILRLDLLFLLFPLAGNWPQLLTKLALSKQKLQNLNSDYSSCSFSISNRPPFLINMLLLGTSSLHFWDVCFSVLYIF